MEIVELFEFGTINLLGGGGGGLLTCAVERFLGLWNVNQKLSCS